MSQRHSEVSERRPPTEYLVADRDMLTIKKLAGRTVAPVQGERESFNGADVRKWHEAALQQAGVSQLSSRLRAGLILAIM